MADDELVECPVCDRPIGLDATSCPACHADFALQGIDELERMAKTLDMPEGPSEETAEDAAMPPSEAERPGQKRGLFSRLFGRSGR